MLSIIKALRKINKFVIPSPPRTHTHVYIQADAAKYIKPPTPIEFAAYEKRLKFTGEINAIKF